MQTLSPASISRAEAARVSSALADELSKHWEELARFMFDRKARPAVYHGPAGDLSHSWPP